MAFYVVICHYETTLASYFEDGGGSGFLLITVTETLLIAYSGIYVASQVSREELKFVLCTFILEVGLQEMQSKANSDVGFKNYFICQSPETKSVGVFHRVY